MPDKLVLAQVGKHSAVTAELLKVLYYFVYSTHPFSNDATENIYSILGGLSMQSFRHPAYDWSQLVPPARWQELKPVKHPWRQ
jgi:hypothetical protein